MYCTYPIRIFSLEPRQQKHSATLSSWSSCGAGIHHVHVRTDMYLLVLVYGMVLMQTTYQIHASTIHEITCRIYLKALQSYQVPGSKLETLEQRHS